MSRFRPTDPWYRQMEADLARDRIERVCTARAEFIAKQRAARSLPPPIVDHDPGDEDRT